MRVGAIGAYSPITYIRPAAGVATASAIQSGMTNESVAKASETQTMDGVQNNGSVNGKAVDKTDPNYECQTCENRKYQDGSDEHDVSFKNTTKVSPEAASSAVRSHEQIHVTNAYEKAEKDNGKVISASVTIHTSICPECGKTYVSGGTTKTQIKYNNEDNPYQQNLKDIQGGFLRGINLDMEV